MGSRGYVRLLVYMSGADRQSMERRRAPSWPCEGWTDWGDASTDGMEGAKLAMRGMDGLGRRSTDGMEGAKLAMRGTKGRRGGGPSMPSFSLQLLERFAHIGKQYREFEKKKNPLVWGERSNLKSMFPLDPTARRTLSTQLCALHYGSLLQMIHGQLLSENIVGCSGGPDLLTSHVRLHSHDDVRRDPPDLPVLGRTQQRHAQPSSSISTIPATHIHKILHITFLLGVAVLQDPGCGRVAQIARIPAISLCWAFSSFRCQRHFRPAFPPGKFRLRGNAWSRRNRYRGLMRDGLEIELLHKLDFERVIILNMCIASGSAYALAVQAPGFERTDRSSIVATSPSSKTPLLQQQNRPWPGHTSYALSNLLIMIMHTRAAFFLDFHHPSHYKNPPHRLLLGVTVRQDPGCGRVAQMARIPVISLCWAFSSFSASRRENTFALLRTILLGVPVPQGASATSDPHFPQESLGYVGMARIC
ncbi:hypothetical protein C8R43DRAFT_966160 [Mycena crocata]|nr:hypothetical protein C8R43DRAFT_966160 [Mycena crocata]